MATDVGFFGKGSEWRIRFSFCIQGLTIDDTQARARVAVVTASIAIKVHGRRAYNFRTHGNIYSRVFFVYREKKK